MKNTLVGLFSLALLLTLVSPVIAAPNVTTYGNTGGINYTQITGILGGSNFIVRIPDTWNGRLIVACPGYAGSPGSELFPPKPNNQLFFDWLAMPYVAKGYAVASLDYGQAGWCVAKGVIRTHQLTEYLVDRLHVTDKIFLVGHSMGGQIALLLAEKYPTLYSGVLDICGGKDGFTGYTYTMFWATQSEETIRQTLQIPESAVPSSMITMLKAFFATCGADIVDAYGGTPTEKPQTYKRYSPVFHTDIEVPIITIAAGIDLLMPMQQHTQYAQAIEEAGKTSLFKLYIVPFGQHGDAVTFREVPAQLDELIEWSDSLS